MPDFDAITVALAARFASPTPPTGYDGVKIATGNLPEGMYPLPCVLVFPNEGDVGPPTTGARRDHDVAYIVRFYYNQMGDLERDTVALRRWLTVLLTRMDGAVQLGGIITLGYISHWQINVFSYAQLDYTGIELTINVHVEEAVTAVA
jgi:hypothetical protein